MNTQQMTDRIAEAVEYAKADLEEGYTCAMILVPDRNWLQFTPCDRDGLHFRASTVHSGLKSLPVDSLTLVGGEKEFDPVGLALAKERLRASRPEDQR